MPPSSSDTAHPEHNNRREAAVARHLARFAACAPGVMYTHRRRGPGDGYFPYVSPAITDLAGLLPADVENDHSPFFRLIPANDRRLIEQAMDDSARTLAPLRVEVRLRPPLKSERWIEIRATPEKEADGGLLWHGFMMDISEQMRQRFQLELTTHALNQVGEAAYLIDDRHRIVQVNDEACRALGYSRDEFKALTVRDFDPDMDAEAVLKIWDDVKRGSRLFETRHKTKDGRIFPVEVNVSHFVFRGRSFNLCLVRDITTRKYIEADLIQREQKFRTLAENNPDPVFRYDRECRRIYVNPAVQKLSGIPPSTLLGKTSVDALLVSAPAAAEVMDSVKRVLKTGKSEMIDVPFTPLDGCERWYQQHHVPEFAADGTVANVISIGRDITERRLYEAELQHRAALQERISSVAQAVPGFLFTLRIEANGRAYFPYASAGVKNLFGLSPDHIRADASVLRARYHPDDLSRALELLATTQRTLEPFRIEMRVLHPEKGLLWIESRSTPQRLPDGATEWHGLIIDITERKRIDEALQDSLHFARELIEAIPSPVFYKDAGGRYLGCNAAFERLFGMRSEEVVGKDVFDIWPTELAERYHAKDRQLLNSAGVQVYEAQLAAPDGRRDVVFHKATFTRADGGIGGLVGVILDVTERVIAEQQLRELQSRLKSVINTIPDLVWMKNVDGEYLACNHAFEGFFGVPESAIVGKTDYDFVAPELADFFRQKDNEALIADRVCLNEETITYAADGRQGHLETRKVPVHDGQGKTIGVLGIARDITEQKRVEAELALREAEFRTLAENSPDIIVRYDRDGRRIYCNPAITRLTGLSHTELLGKTTAERSPYPEAAAKAYTALVRQVVLNGEAGEMDIDWERDGRPACLRLRIAPEFDGEGRVISALAVGRDVSLLKQAEERMRQSHDILRALAIHRTDEQEAERRDLARRMHEDLAQNLSALGMNLSLLEMGAASLPIADTLATLREILNRSIIRVRDMVTMLRPTVLDMGIASALGWLANDFAKGLNLKFTLDIQDDIRLNDESATFLFRAAQEALINTALHGAATHVHVSFVRRDDHCLLMIRDNGLGFDLGAPRRANAFGLIGLTEQARHLGGDLIIRAKPNQGVTLEILIPTTPPAAEPDDVFLH